MATKTTAANTKKAARSIDKAIKGVVAASKKTVIRKVATRPASGTPATRAVPLPTGGALQEDSRVSRLLKLEAGESESVSEVIEDTDIHHAITNQGYSLDELVKMTQARLQQGAMGTAISRAKKREPKAVFRNSVSVHLLTQPVRLCVTCVVTRIE